VLASYAFSTTSGTIIIGAFVLFLSFFYQWLSLKSGILLGFSAMYNIQFSALLSNERPVPRKAGCTG